LRAARLAAARPGGRVDNYVFNRIGYHVGALDKAQA
jgi:hypothetical protein